MKQILFFFSFLSLSIFAFSQSTTADHIKIVAAKDTLQITFKSKSFTLNNIRDLDSCLKKNIPEMSLPVVDLETIGEMTPEDHRAIIVIMDKYRLPVVSERSISSGTGKVSSVVRKAYDH